jgi:hypothetical protein
MSRKWIRRKGVEWQTARTSPARALMARREDEPCECHFDGDRYDPRGCPAHDPEVRQPWA